MTTLYAETSRLKLRTGGEVQALLRAEPGAGRPKCMLLHGNPGSLLDWELILPQLASVADVAVIDMPGFGRSPRPGVAARSLGLDQLAAHVVAVADALGWTEPFFIAGHSHGGGVAQVTAVKYPKRVAGLILIATLGAPTHDSYRLLSLPGAATVSKLVGYLFRSVAMRPLSRKLLFAIMKDIFAPEPVPVARVDREYALFSERPEVLVSMVHVALGQPCKQLLASASLIRCPALFLHGQADALVPVKRARSIHQRIVDAGGSPRFEVVANAGHMLIEFQANLVADHIAHFLGTRTVGH